MISHLNLALRQCGFVWFRTDMCELVRYRTPRVTNTPMVRYRMPRVKTTPAVWYRMPRVKTTSMVRYRMPKDHPNGVV